MMGANKAPGPDGLTAGFYQFHWEILGPRVTAAVLDFLNGGAMPESINNTTSPYTESQEPAGEEAFPSDLFV
jgi:hypothetical protein